MGTAIVLVLLVAAIIGIVHSLTKDRKKPVGLQRLRRWLRRLFRSLHPLKTSITV